MPYNTYRHFASGKRPVPQPDKPKKQRKLRSDVKIPPDLLGEIRRKIARWNHGWDCGDVKATYKDKQIKSPPPVTLPRLVKWLKTEHNVEISTKKLAKTLRRAGFVFGKGNRRYNGHEEAGNVAYRGKYVNESKEPAPCKSDKRQDDPKEDTRCTRRNLLGG